MEPTRFETCRLMLVGLGFFGDPFRLSGGWTEENEIGRLWNRFMAHLAGQGPEIKNLKTPGVAYELHVEHAETEHTGEFEVFVGVEVETLEEVPIHLAAKILPPATYAVFTLQGDEIASDWSRTIQQEWMPRAGYKSAHGFGLQRYDERFKGVDRMGESVLEIYVPVIEAGEAD